MLDLNSDKSIYVQIAEMIEDDILLENLKEDDQAPSTNEFAKVYSINPATARKGLNILVDEDILYKKRGLGMFVSQGARDKVLKKRQEEFYTNVLPEIMRELDILEIDKEDMINYMENYKEGNGLD